MKKLLVIVLLVGSIVGCSANSSAQVDVQKLSDSELKIAKTVLANNLSKVSLVGLDKMKKSDIVVTVDHYVKGKKVDSDELMYLDKNSNLKSINLVSGLRAAGNSVNSMISDDTNTLAEVNYTLDKKYNEEMLVNTSINSTQSIDSSDYIILNIYGYAKEVPQGKEKSDLTTITKEQIKNNYLDVVVIALKIK